MIGDTSERILQTAKGLIANLGYAAFSYADIAEVVQISKASIHHHFPTKASLVVSVLRAHRATMMEGTRLLTEQVADPLERLEAYVQHWEGCIRGKQEPFCIAALLAAEVPSLPEDVQAEVQQHFKDLSGWIRATLEDGLRKRSVSLEASAEVQAYTFMAVFHGAMLSARALGNCDVFHTVTTNALDRLRM